MFKRLNIRQKFAAGFLVISFVLLLELASFLYLQKVIADADSIRHRNEKIVMLLGDLEKAVASIVNYERGYLLTADYTYTDERGTALRGDSSFLPKVEEQIRKGEEALRQLEGLVDEDGKQKVQEIKDKFTLLKNNTALVVSAFQVGDMKRARDLSNSSSGQTADRIMQLSGELHRHVMAEGKEYEVTSHSTMNFLTAAVIVAIALAGFILFVIGYLLPRHLAFSLVKIKNQAEEMARGIMVGEAVEVNSNDELGALAQAFNSMRRDFRHLLERMIAASAEVAENTDYLRRQGEEAGKTVQQVAAAIQEVARGSSEQSESIGSAVKSTEQLKELIKATADRAAEQAHRTDQTSEIINQMARAIEEVARNAQGVSEVARETSQAASGGKTAVENTVAGMNDIREKVFATATRVRELGESSQQIGEILRVIDEIAEQTNLLALNAAIEAARAGEHGKGFAVVADEVRKLAERSAKATREIAHLVENIQGETARAVAAMESGVAGVEEGVKLAEKARAALEKILDLAGKTYDQVQNISAAVEEMTASSSEVVMAVEQLARIARENATAAEEMEHYSDNVLTSINNTAAVVTENAAAAEEVSASADEMTGVVAGIAEALKNLDETVVELNSIGSRFLIRESKVRCWEILHCPPERKEKCPAAATDDPRCWLIEGTWCEGVKQGDAEKKKHRCMKCKAYWTIMGGQEGSK